MKYHHLIVDGWGTGIVVRRTAEIYNRLTSGQTAEAKTRYSYIDFIHDDREYARSEKFETHKHYWMEKFEDIPSPLIPPKNATKHLEKNVPNQRETLIVSRTLYNRLNEYAAANNVTPFHVVLAALYVYFVRTTGRSDFVAGLPILNRRTAAFKETVGLFTGVIPAKFSFGTRIRVRQLLESIRKELRRDFRYQRFPLSEINRGLRLFARGRSQLFDLCVSYDIADFDCYFGESPAESIPLANGYNQYPLLVSICEYNQAKDVRINFDYSTAYYDASEIRPIKSRVEWILGELMRDGEALVFDVCLTPDGERFTLLNEWNDAAFSFPKDKTIVNLFEEQATKTAERTAVVFGDRSLTYGELNRRANQLCRYLRKTGVGEDDFVGLFMERSLDLAPTLLGVLKAGAAYAPLDISDPQERVAFAIEDAKPAAIVTVERLASRIPECGVPIIPIDEEWERIAEEDDSNLDRRLSPSHLAYINYTSGTTGKPKGVCIEHRSVVRLAADPHYIHITGNDALLHYSSISFDASTFEIWGALLNGAQLIVAPQERLSIRELGRIINTHRISILWTTAGLFHQIGADDRDAFRPVRVWLAGGDVLNPSKVETLLDAFPHCEFMNGYGPTENTTFTTHHSMKGARRFEGSIPIGKPIDGTKVYILDESLRPCPIGVVGTLYASGVGLARGYLNRPKLTAERFIPNPFDEVPGSRMYNSGDSAQWLSDGTIEFVGRTDAQVKIRGFRVEMGEIESVLTTHASIENAAVTVREDETGDKRLVAYVMFHPGESLERDDLRGWLESKLPSYMVPSFFVVLDEFPLSSTGKVDRKALPAPEQSVLQSKYIPPQTPTEELLAAIWSDVLKASPIGRHDHFFMLGGHSLLATQAASRIRDVFSIELPLRTIFEHPTLLESAEQIDRLGNEKRADAPIQRRSPGMKGAPLSYPQHLLWLLDRLYGANSTFNMPIRIRLRGELKIDVLELTFREIVERHEALRTRFTIVDGHPQQIVDENDFSIKTVRIDRWGNGAEEEIVRLADEEAQRPFDLSRDRLIRATLYVLSDNSYVLLITMHHIVSDGWSIHLFFHELSVLYESINKGIEHPLKKPAIQYADFAVWQRNLMKGETLERLVGYWRERLEGVPAFLEFPFDRPRSNVMTNHGVSRFFQWDKEFCQRLHVISKQSGTTLFMTLLSGMAALLSQYSGQDDIVVGSPIANRTRNECESSIGLFASTLALRVNLRDNPTLPSLFEQVKQTCQGAYAHQEIPFEFLVEQLQPKRSLSYTPLFQVMLALQNTPPNELTLPNVETNVEISERGQSIFALTVSFTENKEALDGKIEYNTDLIERDSADTFIERYRNVLEMMAAKPSGRISDFNTLSKSEQKEIEEKRKNARPYISHGRSERLIVDIARGLLGLERIEPHDDFIELGGDSIFAARLVNRIRSAFSLEIPIQVIFEYPNASALAERLDTATSEDWLKVPPIRPSQRSVNYPVSYEQARILKRITDEKAVIANTVLVIRMDGFIETEILERAIGIIVRRHEILRTRFIRVDNEWKQSVYEREEFSIQIQDARSISGDSYTERIDEIVRREKFRKIDIEDKQRIHVSLWKIDERTSVLSIAMHPTIADRESARLFYGELVSCYDALARNQKGALDDLPVQYGDYAVWQRDWFSEGEREPSMADCECAASSLSMETQTITLDEEWVQRIPKTCRVYKSTPFMIFLGAWNLAVSKTLGIKNASFGVPNVNRTRWEIENSIGVFENTLAIGLDARIGEPLFEYMERVKERCLQAYARLSHAPAFPFRFEYRDDATALSPSPYQFECVHSNLFDFDWMISASKHRGGYVVESKSKPSLFDSSTVERALAFYQDALKEMGE